MVILASASPRRRELLRRICSHFDVLPSGLAEDAPAGPAAVAVRVLATRKARAVAARVGRGLVLGADTLVVLGDVALGKPGSAHEARDMLERLRGRAHAVITAVTLVDAASRQTGHAVVVSQVFMRDYSDADIAAYVASGEPFDKAGGYGIQEQGGELVAGLIGSYSNVVGLPLEATASLLAEFGEPTIPATGPRSPF